MSLIHRVGAGLLVVGGMLPVQVEACWLFGGCGCGPAPCGVMAQPICGPAMGPMFGPAMAPMGDCGCGNAAPMIVPEPAPMMVPQTMMRPVIETRMRPQQITTFAEVPRTVTRREAVQVQVPTTTVEQVTVDEGGFQQVWVPRMVTKQVPRTVMQTQTQYRDVATQVTERVPQVTTQWVPEQVVRHVPQTVMGTACETGNIYGAAYQPHPIATPTTITPIPESQPANPVPTPSDAQSARPQTSQIQEWQTVRQRSSIQQQSYEEASPGYRVPKAAGRFSSPAR